MPVGEVTVTTGAVVSRMKETPARGETLPAWSVAWRFTVWVPSAEPFVDNWVTKLYAPDEASKLTGKNEPPSSWATSEATPEV